MKARTYALALIAAAAGLFVSVAAANLVIDPAGIFGTSPLPKHDKNANERYLQFAAYKADEARFEGLLFGSSRARVIPLDGLAHALGVTSVASFAVNGGVLADHVAVLDYVVRKASPGRPVVRTVFVLLDPDNIGSRPPTNFGPATYLAPELTGESKLRFWWKNLTGVTFLLWKNAVREAFGAPEEPDPNLGALPSRSLAASLGAELSPSAAAQELGPAALPAPRAGGPERIAARPHYGQDMQRWHRFVELCRRGSIELVAAIAPLHRRSLARYEDLSRVVDDLAAGAPVWDFTGFEPLLDDATLWRDESHFTRPVAALMLRRIAGESMPSGWEEFGHLRGGTAQR